MAHPHEVGSLEQRRRPGRAPGDLLPGSEIAQEPLPADGEVGIGRDDGSPRVVDLAGDRDDRPGAGLPPRGRDIPDPEALADDGAELDPPVRRLSIVEDRRLDERLQDELDPGRAEHVEFDGRCARLVDADESGRPQSEPCRRQRGVRDAAAQAPAARIVAGEVAAGGADVQDLESVSGHHLLVNGWSWTESYTSGPIRSPHLESTCSSTSCAKATTTSSPRSMSSANRSGSRRSSSSSSSRSAAGSRTPSPTIPSARRSPSSSSASTGSSTSATTASSRRSTSAWTRMRTSWPGPRSSWPTPRKTTMMMTMTKTTI